ncbi:BZ3500_MvSof-1268-A1-R1_Chr1-3g02297 [Microbotryum saponariae]|uniref:BZ3500_MvSof-1268-A1-R1_Chr1-3g02297 protein n=1 Tax=Microbotryum saponariae TaxID=289078 RepID=A0A2X0MFV5_9BASI|nr:BZ3500_MvSof-1268-A1-R1_Chr1-3g02297 [Microbotryum saponariae]SCZ95912.1 BZ3501_MvSof-1269-A2-R1_Chr1-3g01900 [Microbotryum saponariae]
MEAVSPPLYSSTAASVAAPPVLLNVAPLSTHHDFLHGHLGYGQASLQGEVQVKYTSEHGHGQAPRPSKLEVCFRGVERRHGLGEIELCEQRKTLWGWGAQGSSSSMEQGDDVPPPSTVFKFDVTQDLPHCIHLAQSSLEYTLTATLHSDDASVAPLVQCVPIHLARTSPPGPLSSDLVSSAPAPTSADGSRPSLSPQSVSRQDPIHFTVHFSRTIFRRSEPIQLVVKIPVPDFDAVTKGLRLRTVSAELVRRISLANDTDDDPPAVSGKQRDQVVSTAVKNDDIDSLEFIQHPSSSDALLDPSYQSTMVLARSGKSARFSPTRPIVIRLLLHPSTTQFCESITQVCSPGYHESHSRYRSGHGIRALIYRVTRFTQSTILHHMNFSVIVTVGLLNNRSQRDVTVSRDVHIVPDPPMTSTTLSEKQRQVEAEVESVPPGWTPAEGSIPSYHESAVGDVAVGTSSDFREGPSRVGSTHVFSTNLISEEEYDGYEELSASLSTRAPPPTIDADVSPPSHDEEDSDSMQSTEETSPGFDATPLAPPDDFAGEFFRPVDPALQALRRPLDSDEEEEDPALMYVSATLEDGVFLDLSGSAPPSNGTSTHSSAANSPVFRAVQDVSEQIDAATLDDASPPPYVGDTPQNRSDLHARPPSFGTEVTVARGHSRSTGIVEVTDGAGGGGVHRDAPGASASPSLRPPPPSYTSHQDVVLRLTEQGDLVRMVRDVEGVI